MKDLEEMMRDDERRETDARMGYPSPTPDAPRAAQNVQRSTHTQGPWFQSSTVLVCSAEAKVIANCTPLHEIPELAISILEADANARLIAAAPDLLKALEALLTMMDRGPQPQKLDDALTWRENDDMARRLATNAIRKAKS